MAGRRRRPPGGAPAPPHTNPRGAGPDPTAASSPRPSKPSSQASAGRWRSQQPPPSSTPIDQPSFPTCKSGSVRLLLSSSGTRVMAEQELHAQPIVPSPSRAVADVSHQLSRSYADAVKKQPTATVQLHLHVPRNLPLSWKEDTSEGDRFSTALLGAAPRISVGADFQKEEVPMIIKICSPHIGYPMSIQNLHGFSKEHRLVRPVEIFSGKMTIQLATTQGRLLFQTAMAVIWFCHSKNKSWDGSFGFEHIRIITPRMSMEKYMMILKDPVEYGNKARLLQAMANDLQRAAMIFIPLYKVCKGFPVYFVELKEDLQGVTSELVANERFWDYLRYHPAIMPSTGRNIFMTKLNSTRAGNAIRPVMLSKPTVYPHDWKTIVESETESNKDGKDTIKVLNNVYYHNKQPGKEYENTTRGLCRFIRNVLEHGKEHDARVINGYELELYLAKMFSRFLPCILQTLLVSGKMEELYGEDWAAYKSSKSNNWEPTWFG